MARLSGRDHNTSLTTGCAQDCMMLGIFVVCILIIVWDIILLIVCIIWHFMMIQRVLQVSRSVFY